MAVAASFAQLGQKPSSILGLGFIPTETIDNIAHSGEAAAIMRLAPYALGPEPDVARAALQAIDRLVSSVPRVLFPGLQLLLRGDHWNSHWATLPLNDSHRWPTSLLRLLTCHPSGYERAKAIRSLAARPDPADLPFLVLRLCDWVAPVRALAVAEFHRRLEPASAPVLVECLELLGRLSRATRFDQQHLTAVEGLLRTPACAAALRAGMAAPRVGVRRTCFRLAFDSAAFARDSLLIAAFADLDGPIRLWAVENSANLPVRDDLIEKATRDPWPPLRRLAFDELTSGIDHQLMERFLLDGSPGLRHKCQATLAQRMSLARFYRERLPHRFAIAGLSETGTSGDGPLLTPLLASVSVRVRREAIKALIRLRSELPAARLSQFVSTDAASVAQTAVRALLTNHRTAPQSVWLTATQNPAPSVRKEVLKHLDGAGKWTRLRLYLTASADAEPAVATAATQALSRWLQNFNRSFTTPTTQDRDACRLLLQQARDRLGPKTVREIEHTLAR